MAEIEQKIFFVVIAHYHAGKLGSNTGQVVASNEEEATKKAKPWIEQIMDKYGCKSSLLLNNCGIMVSEHRPGLSGCIHSRAAEQIERPKLVFVKK